MKQSRRHRPAPTRKQVHQQLNRIARDHSSHFAIIPPVSYDQLALFDWMEEDAAGLEDAA